MEVIQVLSGDNFQQCPVFCFPGSWSACCVSPALLAPSLCICWKWAQQIRSCQTPSLILSDESLCRRFKKRYQMTFFQSVCCNHITSLMKQTRKEVEHVSLWRDSQEGVPCPGSLPATHGAIRIGGTWPHHFFSSSGVGAKTQGFAFARQGLYCWATPAYPLPLKLRVH